MNILLIITIASLALAAVTSVVAWRTIAEERRRSEARVRALAAGIVRFEPSPEPSPTRCPEDALASRAPDNSDTGMQPATTFAALFATISARTGPRISRRTVAIAGGVLVVAGGAALAVAPSVGSRTRARGATHAPVAPAAAIARRPLELLALDHQRDGNRLTVRGVVHNPSDAAAVKGLIPVVFVFDRNGGFVTSGRGTLEAATLGPGADSTFVVAVTDVADVGRYRVSFRTDDRVLAHVDRRSETRN